MPKSSPTRPRLPRFRNSIIRASFLPAGRTAWYDPASPHYEREILSLGVPVLGICYGAQLIAWLEGGEIEAAENGSEHGKVEVSARAGSLLFQDVPACSQCWMSHTDYIKTLPAGYRISADTGICPVAAMENAEKKIYAVQFHPEVTHTAFRQADAP